MTDKEKIRAEIERLRKFFQLKYQQLEPDDKLCIVACGKRNLCNDLISFINSLPEEPIGKTWHDASEKPIVDKTILLMSPNGNSSLGLWGGKEFHSVTIGGGHNVICQGDRWAYVSDLLHEKEESVSDDLENTAKDYSLIDEGESVDEYGVYDIDKYKAFKAGAQWKELRLIEKVCEWIEETNRYHAPTNFNVENFKAYMKNHC